MDEGRLQAWLDAYVRAWETYDPLQIAELFSEDAAYYADPFDEGIRGRQAIVDEWLAEPDEPGTWRAEYRALLVSRDVGVATGTSWYEADEHGPAREYRNLFVLTFDADGRCREYREWYVRRSWITGSDAG